MRKFGVPAAGLREIVGALAPGPAMTRLLLISNSPLVRRILPLTAKSMVSPDAARAIACRKEPVPLSAVVVTVMVAARTGRTTRLPSNSKEKTMRFLIITERTSQESARIQHFSYQFL